MQQQEQTHQGPEIPEEFQCFLRIGVWAKVATERMQDCQDAVPLLLRLWKSHLTMAATGNGLGRSYT